MSKSDALKSYIPEFLTQSKVFQAIYNVQGTELDDLNSYIEGILNQCFVDTATWGLKYWEQFLAIPVDESKAYADRRSVIKSKLRGVGTVTTTLMKTVAQSYDNGEISIIEHPDAYSFEVKFIGTRGIPPNLNDLKAAIEEIKPAHLAVTYIFTYTSWGEVKSTTWATVKTSTWNNLLTRKVI